MNLVKNISILGALLAGTSFANNDLNNENEGKTDNRDRTDLIQDHTPEDDSLREYFETDTNDENDNPSKYAQAPAGDDATAPATAPADAGTATAPAGAPGKKKMKKKKGAVSVDQAAMSTGHGAQESGLPYKAGVDIDLTYSSESKTKKYSDKSQKQSTTSMGLDLDYLFILGHIEVGPKITFLSKTEKTPNDADNTVSDVDKTSAIGFGLGFVFDMGNIHQDSLVPYVDMSVVRESKTLTQTTGGATDSTKYTDTDMRVGLGGGAKIFMGGHIALKPFLKYELIMSGESKTEVTGSDATVASVTGSNLSLGMGLAKYF